MISNHPPEPPRGERTRSRAARIFFGVDLAFGILLLAGAALLTSFWWSPGDDPHGGAFALLGAMWLAMGALLFLFAAGAIRAGWRAWWIVQLLPLFFAAPLALSVL